MEKELIYKHKLFEGISENEINSLLSCLGCKTEDYKKQNIVYSEGEIIDSLGIVLSGSLHLYAYDFYGNRQIITDIKKGEMFAESVAIAKSPLPFEITATEDSRILFINFSKLSAVCPKACSFHTVLINNTMRILAVKNISLTQKILHLTAKNVREKVLSYLNYVAKQKKSKYFDIPFSRQELADYLSVDRSNLSNELSKLKEAGLIEYEKNHFKIK